LPRLAAFPDKRDFVIADAIAAAEKTITDAREALARLKTNSSTKTEKLKEQELNISIAELRHSSLRAIVPAEKLEDENKKNTEEWNQAATRAATIGRKLAWAEAQLKVHLAQVAEREMQAKSDRAAKALEPADNETLEKDGEEKPDLDKIKKQKDAAEKAAKELESARKKTSEAEKALADAEKELAAAPTTAYKPRSTESYPQSSTGRRLAFARWVTSLPLTARVAMNHVWLRHFGQGLVSTPADFGNNGRPPSHPQLLDWLAVEFMTRHWSMKAMHRLIVTSSAYRMASTPEEANARIDPDNVYLWRMNSRRMEAELVRDNLLYMAGSLDPGMGGPEIDHKLGLTSKRRSIYLRLAAEKEVEFLKVFDGPAVTECYERKPSVMPQQSLALANSEITLAQSRTLARILASEADDETKFIRQAFLRILARLPNEEELRLCREFLGKPMERSKPKATESATAVSLQAADKTAAGPEVRARENLVLVLFNHNDFLTIR